MKLQVLAGLALASLLAMEPPLSAQGGPADRWVGTWATAGVAVPSQPSAQPQLLQPGEPPRFNNQTLRQIVHTSIGGERARVVLTNVFGTRPLTIGGAHLALRERAGAIAPASNRALTFGGVSAVKIPPGAGTMIRLAMSAMVWSASRKGTFRMLTVTSPLLSSWTSRLR